MDIFSKDERKNLLLKERKAITRADSILVVGGGPVGIEYLGELAHMNS